jgi:peptidoglycan-associated lipoprotein
MKRIGRGVCLIAILSLVFFAFGCAKKKVEQVGEVTPPSQQKEVGPPSEMGMQMPKGEGGVQSTPQGGAVSGDVAVFEKDDIFFDYDKFSIRPEARKVLSEKAAFLNAHPQMNVKIEGNCDERGTSEYNLALGERRAKSAQDYLVFLGVKPDRISIISYGEEKPLDPGHNEAAWSKNRRDHFVIAE